MRRTGPIIAYTSGHGFGHGARTGQMLRAVQRLAPACPIMVRTATPSWLYPSTAECVRVQTDVGIVQVDSLTPCIDETVDRALAFERARPGLATAECEALAGLQPRLVVSDIPPLAFDVASTLGVPSVAIGNFNWSWIYRNMGSDRPEIAEIVASIERSEQRADLLLRLPMHDEMRAFRRIEDAPLIAHISDADRDVTRQKITRADARPLALVSFGGMGLRSLDLSALANTPEAIFVLTSEPASRPPDNVVVCTDDRIPYHDVLAACDVVIMKPGYGTVADCLANRVPMVYSTRPGFAEEQILVPAMHAMGRAVFVSNDDLFAGRLGPAIQEAIHLTTPWEPVPRDGADQIARRLLEVAGTSPD
ncbi:MAG TPA: hypothetical protein VFC51_11375 [Chloroflexota bacterium]|nr:hypothetical protein [Chloroflexota bacterium]